MTAPPDPEVVLHRALLEAMDREDAAAGLICLGRAGADLQPESAWVAGFSRPERTLVLAAGVTRDRARRVGAQRIQSTPQADIHLLRPGRAAPEMAIPLDASASFLMAERDDPWTRRMARAFSIYLAFAARVEQARSHDALTGLANRRGFRCALVRSLARNRRHGMGLGVGLFDVDRFKALNDSEGHAAGDRCLTTLGQGLRDLVRTSDLAARLGGDEFGLLADPVDAPGCFALAERLQARMNAPDRPRTMSGCLAWLRGGLAPDMETVLAFADREVYEIKRTGGGRIAARTFPA